MYENTEVTNLLRAIAQNTRDIADLLEVAYGPQLRRLLLPVVSDPRKRAVYEASTGQLSSREVASRASVSDKTVRDWWRDWYRAGLLRPSDLPGRFSRKYDLARLSLGEEAEQ